MVKKSLTLKRHLLLDISDRGREEILNELAGQGPDSAVSRDRYAKILLPEQAGARVPGIVRREEKEIPPGTIPVGFSGAAVESGERLRVAAFVGSEHVVRMTSPYELLASEALLPRNACLAALEAVKTYAQTTGLVLGLWGSAATELYTGLPCTHQDSDLDLVVAVNSRQALTHFLIEVDSIEKRFGLRVDVELDLPDGYGIHLRELFGPGRTVLGKSLTAVKLLSREKILSELPIEPFARFC